MAHLKGSLRELSLFTGAGGGILGSSLLGFTTVCAVEYEPFPISTLACRQNEGLLPPFPIWDDVRTFNGLPWRGRAELVSGGFPCQDISVAGTGDGLDGSRSGLWREMSRIIGEVRPRFVFIENSLVLTSRGLDQVLADLAALGYDAEWLRLSAAHVGANHIRYRLWILGADTAGQGLQGYASEIPKGRHQSASVGQREQKDILHPSGLGHGSQDEVRAGRHLAELSGVERAIIDSPWWVVEPGLGRVAHGVANRVDRIKAVGNGQVPHVAFAAWNILYYRMFGQHFL